MVEEINDKEDWINKKLFAKQNKGSDVYRITSQSETMSEKLSWLPRSYWKVINQESESDDEITEKDVCEADLSDIEKFFDKNSTAYRIFEVLRKKWLRIFINPKTDISFTSKYNIILWRWPITQKSRYTMEIQSNASDEEVYITKLVHEMWHSLVSYIPDEVVSKKELFNTLVSMRRGGRSITKLWDLDRYTDLSSKATEDWVEFIRMYIQNPENFKKYLWKILGEKYIQVQEYLYDRTKKCVDVVLNKSSGKE